MQIKHNPDDVIWLRMILRAARSFSLSVFLCLLGGSLHSLSYALELPHTIQMKFDETVDQDQRVSLKRILHADEGKFLQQTIKNIHGRDLLFDDIHKLHVKQVASGAKKRVYRVELIDSKGAVFVFALKVVKNPRETSSTKEIQAIQDLSETGLVARLGAVARQQDPKSEIVLAFTTEFIKGITLAKFRKKHPELMNDRDTVRTVIQTWMKAWDRLGIGFKEASPSSDAWFIFSDPHPGNIMYRMNEDGIQGSPVIVDMGCCRRASPIYAFFLMSLYYGEGFDVENESFRGIWEAMSVTGDRSFYQRLLDQTLQFKETLSHVAKATEGEPEVLQHNLAAISHTKQADENPAPRAKVRGFGDSPSSPSRPRTGRGPHSSAGLPWGGVKPLFTFFIDEETPDSDFKLIQFEDQISASSRKWLEKALLAEEGAFLRETVKNIFNESLSLDEINSLSVSTVVTQTSRSVYKVELFDQGNKRFAFILTVSKRDAHAEYELRALQLIEGTGSVPRLGAVIKGREKGKSAHLIYSKQFIEGITANELWRDVPSWIQNEEKVRQIAKTFMSAWVTWNGVEGSWQGEVPALWINNISRKNIVYLAEDGKPHGMPIMLDCGRITRWYQRRFNPLEILIAMNREYSLPTGFNHPGMLPILEGFADALGKDKAKVFFADALATLEQLEKLVVRTLEVGS